MSAVQQCRPLAQRMLSRKLPASNALVSARLISRTTTNGDLLGVLNWGGRDHTQHSHSSMLSESSHLYEYSRHYVKPGHMKEYWEIQEKHVELMTKKLDGCELVGAFENMFNDTDQAVHIYRFDKNFEDLDQLIDMKQTDKDYIAMANEIGRLCRRRRSHIMRSFSYWGEPKPRKDKHIYDLRQYVLKPGQMIEWGNNWVKGIQYRRDHNQDVGGWFSQIGQLYCVYHLWAYKSLQARAKVREHTWSKPGWDRTVAYTVPLIKSMESKIMAPAKYSPLQ